MNRKIKRIGKVCGIFSKIFTILMIIATAGLVIAGTVLVAIPDNLIRADVSGSAQIDVYGEWIDKIPEDQIEKISSQIKEGTLNFTINANRVDGIEREGDSIVLQAGGSGYSFSLRKTGFAVLSYSLVTGALIAVFIMLEKLMKEIAEGDSPFTEAVVKRMTGFAISLIPYAVIKPLAGGLGKALMTTGSFDINFGVDLSTAFAALLIILFIMIFKHGAEIQRESDETL